MLIIFRTSISADNINRKTISMLSVRHNTKKNTPTFFTEIYQKHKFDVEN